MESIKILPTLPAKRYFTIGEVSDLCGVKAHVLRYWEQEFHQLRPMKRRGNRRYYQHHEVSMIRCIRELLYDQGFTISGARNKLDELVQSQNTKSNLQSLLSAGDDISKREKTNQYLFEESATTEKSLDLSSKQMQIGELSIASAEQHRLEHLRHELSEIRNLLSYSC